MIEVIVGDAQQRNGWDDHTMVVLLTEFIRQQSRFDPDGTTGETLAAFLRKTQEAEAGGPLEGAG